VKRRKPAGPADRSRCAIEVRFHRCPRFLPLIGHLFAPYVCDWVNDDQPYLFEIGNPSLVSLPYSVQTNDVPAYFEMKVSVPEFEAMLRRQFDTLYREGETIPRVMAIAGPIPLSPGSRTGSARSTRYSSTSARMPASGAPPAGVRATLPGAKRRVNAALWTGEPETADRRRFQCRPYRVDSKTEARQVRLESLATASMMPPSP
jgi:hypothetical protein